MEVKVNNWTTRPALPNLSGGWKLFAGLRKSISIDGGQFRSRREAVSRPSSSGQDLAHVARASIRKRQSQARS